MVIGGIFRDFDFPDDVFVYSKSEYTIESVSVSVRLHDNSSKAHLIVMKFCTQNCLINISVEFEDENDSSRNGLVIAKNVPCEH